MHKILIAVPIFLILLLCVFFRFNNSPHPNLADYKIINYQLENKNLHLLVSDNQQKWERGLMNVKKLNSGIDGMIFIFPQKDWQSFWNKNTLMNLDLYWIVDDKVVGKDFLPAVKENEETLTITSPQEVDKVVEIPR